jgi:YidC/Oxa1 family membrane protein insertase
VDRNALLAIALSMLVLSLWMAWEGSNRPPEPPPTAAEQAASPESPAAPAPAQVSPSTPAAVTAKAPTAPPSTAPAVEQTTTLENAVVRAIFTSRGAGVQRLELLRYSTPRSEGGGPVALIDAAPGEMPAFATPLPELGLGDLGSVVYRIAANGPHEVGFEYTQSGVHVRKTFTLDDDTYRLRMRLEVANDGAAAVSPAFGVDLLAVARTSSDFKDLAAATLSGGSVHKAPVAAFGRASLLSRQPTLEQDFAGDVEWAGAYSHYFVSAILPDASRDARAHWKVVTVGQQVMVSVDQPPAAVLPGTSLDREFVTYVGPKEPELLAAAGNQLERSIDLGWSWVAPITRLFTWMLKACHQIIPNYGVAIIVLTALVRLATAPLAARQMRSMRRMSEIQPKVKALQEKYADDRQQQSQEMMKLYREAGVNPLGGCLPLLLQFPVLIGLYYALQSSIDLRQAPFGLWIDDLSRPETLFTIPGVNWPVRVLPILMTISMVLQQRMTPSSASMDPAQQRTMMVVMPVMFFFMFYGFPSGLVLYWFVSNLLAVAQQLYLNRQMGPKPA